MGYRSNNFYIKQTNKRNKEKINEGFFLAEGYKETFVRFEPEFNDDQFEDTLYEMMTLQKECITELYPLINKDVSQSIILKMVVAWFQTNSEYLPPKSTMTFIASDLLQAKRRGAGLRAFLYPYVRLKPIVRPSQFEDVGTKERIVFPIHGLTHAKKHKSGADIPIDPKSIIVISHPNLREMQYFAERRVFPEPTEDEFHETIIQFTDDGRVLSGTFERTRSHTEEELTEHPLPEQYEKILNESYELPDKERLRASVRLRSLDEAYARNVTNQVIDKTKRIKIVNRPEKFPYSRIRTIDDRKNAIQILTYRHIIHAARMRGHTITHEKEGDTNERIIDSDSTND